MLWAIMAAVGTVRILGLSRGLPDIIASPGGDEKYFVETALLVAAHRSYSQAFHSLPNFFMPSPYSFLLLIAYGFYFVAGLVAGKFHGVDDLIFQFLTDRTMFYLLGRWISVLASVAALYLIYRIACFFMSYRFCLLAVFLYACFPLEYFRSRWALPESVTELACLIALFYWLKTAREDSLQAFRWGVFWSAVAVSFRINVAPVLFPGFCLAGRLSRRNGQSLAPWLWFAVVPPVYLLLNPYFITDFREAVHQCLALFGLLKNEYATTGRGALFIWPLAELAKTAGLGLLMILGLGRMIWKALRPGPERVAYGLLALFTVPLYLWVGSSPRISLHYMLSVYPLACISGVSFGERWARLRPRLAPWIYGLAALSVIAPLSSIASEVNARTGKSFTQMAAKEWIEQNIPAKTRIAMDALIYGPPLYNWSVFDSSKIKSLSRSLRSRLRRHYEAQKAFEIVSALEPSFMTTDRARRLGVSYLIVSSGAYDRYIEGALDLGNPLYPEFTKKQAFYRSLFAGASPQQGWRLIEEFRPGESLAGPTIRIYRLEEGGSPESRIRQAF
ncbi:MAG: glycosyltransferase family 39 protein [Armatimonadetes bacterium]|nr:glycosyltransferase family 39 protein [Armatimonadota bacterium]